MTSSLQITPKSITIPRLVQDGDSLAPANEPTEFMAELSTLMAGSEQNQALALLNTIVRAVPARDDGKVSATNEALAAIGALAPKDGLEAMMACSAVSLFQHAMSLLGRSGSTHLPGLSDVRLALSDKLFRQFLAHVRAIDAHRRQAQPQQHIVVEHIHVGQGGQMAIMGQVQTGGGRS